MINIYMAKVLFLESDNEDEIAQIHEDYDAYYKVTKVDSHNIGICNPSYDLLRQITDKYISKIYY